MKTIDSVSVTVIIVNWNGHRDTMACVNSLRCSRGVDGPVKVVIVDNGSSDGSVQSMHQHLTETGWIEILDIQINTEFARVKHVSQFNSNDGTVGSVVLIEARENYGFAAGNNIGWSVANELWNSEFFWLLNNDTMAAPDAMNWILDKMSREPKVAVCGCTIMYADGTQRVQTYGGAWYSIKTGRGWSVGMDEVYDSSRSDSSAEALINYVSGAAMLIRGCVWAEIGPLCEDYFLYNEEIDFAMRLPRGHRLGVATKALVYHKVGGSIGTDKGSQVGSRLSTFFQARSKLLFALNHTPQYWPLVWLTLLARAIKLMAKPSTRKNALVILAVLAGRRQVDAAWFGERLILDADIRETLGG